MREGKKPLQSMSVVHRGQFTTARKEALDPSEQLCGASLRVFPPRGPGDWGMVFAIASYYFCDKLAQTQ